MFKLWYKKPASHWREALPIGNGHTGVMIYGKKRFEKLCFNDGTLWSGYPKDYNNKQSFENLFKIRELIFAGKNKEADALIQEKLCGFYSEAYMPVGEVKIKISSAGISNYFRELDLSKAIHTVNTKYCQREAFASNPKKVVVYSITAKHPINICVKMKCKLKAQTHTDNNMMFITGHAPDYVAPNYLRNEIFPVKYNENKGMAFALAMAADTDGNIESSSKKITIKNARVITLYFVTETGFKKFDEMPITDTDTVKQKCISRLKNILKYKYEEIKKEHIADFSSLFSKQSISLKCKSDLTTDKLLKAAKKGDDIRPLCELFYNLGKYMTISASRKGGQAMNLQGIWNNSVRPPWSCNYTVNINTQMNYWGASSCGLDECIEPLLQLVWETVQNGKLTAKINYGCSGFACNHNVDIWRKTSPVKGTPNYMLEPLCGVWLANEVYSHYKNGSLQNYKEKVLEIIEEAARFAADYLVLKDETYVICPSASPENCFKKDGNTCYTDYASAFDMGLVVQAFYNVLESSDDLELKADITEKLKRIAPFTQGKYGINEWHTDYFTPEKGHRHFSPIYAFYPAKLIGYNRDKEQTEWIRRLFKYRLDNSSQHIGWSAAWAICIAARLRDAKTAETVTKDFLCKSVFKNLFCVHPPYLFQIDGNLGYIAGLNEMLITEENGIIELLPALPDSWKNGEVKNIIINGVSITFKWENFKVTSIESNKPIVIRKVHLSDKIIKSETVSEEN